MVVESSGRICVHADPLVPGTQSYRRDAPVHLKYQSVGTCLSSNCTRDRSATCTTAMTGGTIEVTTVGTWIDASAEQNNACQLDCVMLEADCATDPLAAGTYAFRFASNVLSLVIPSEHAEAPCVDSP
jgi:hypothetical protein